MGIKKYLLVGALIASAGVGGFYTGMSYSERGVSVRVNSVTISVSMKN